MTLHTLRVRNFILEYRGVGKENQSGVKTKGHRNIITGSILFLNIALSQRKRIINIYLIAKNAHGLKYNASCEKAHFCRDFLPQNTNKYYL